MVAVERKAEAAVAAGAAARAAARAAAAAGAAVAAGAAAGAEEKLAAADLLPGAGKKCQSCTLETSATGRRTGISDAILKSLVA